MNSIRDMTELEMISIKEWTDLELRHFHHTCQQILPYLNEEGQTLYKEIVMEIGERNI